MGSAFLERRKAPRFQGELPVEFGKGMGVTRDFSASGVYFMTGQSLTPGEKIEFSLILEHAVLGTKVRIRCQGEVLRIEPFGEEKIGVAVPIHSYSLVGIQLYH